MFMKYRVDNHQNQVFVVLIFLYSSTLISFRYIGILERELIDTPMDPFVKLLPEQDKMSL